MMKYKQIENINNNNINNNNKIINNVEEKEDIKEKEIFYNNDNDNDINIDSLEFKNFCNDLSAKLFGNKI